MADTEADAEAHRQQVVSGGDMHERSKRRGSKVGESDRERERKLEKELETVRENGC